METFCEVGRSFFLFYHTRILAYLDYGGALFGHFPAAVRAMAARCKRPLALRPGLPLRSEDPTVQYLMVLSGIQLTDLTA
jgi:hypothetical protein